MASSPPEIAALQQENARLIALLQAHGIEWRLPPEPVAPPKAAETSRLTTDEKVALFRRLFHGRTDIYPVRWESKTSGKSGYSPACTNEWRAGVCEKPRIKCGDCSSRLLAPLSDAVIYNVFVDADLAPYPDQWAFLERDAAAVAGRLHRQHTGKSDVRIIDFVDTGHPALLRMWDKRQRGYRAMGYRIASETSQE